MTKMIVAALAAGTLTAPALADGVAENAESICPILVGATLPDAIVRTVDGEAVALRDAVTGDTSVLVVYRGGWCPVCTKQFFALNEVIEPLEELGVGLFAMSVDGPETLVAGRDADTPFTLLSDLDLHASKALGLAFHVTDEYVDKLAGYGLDTSGNALATAQVLPVPAVFVLDAEGTITFSYINPTYTERCDPDVLLAAARAAATK